MQGIGPVEDLEEIPIDQARLDRTLKIGSALDIEVRKDLVRFLNANIDVFAWTHDDMEGISPEVMSHRLNVDPGHPPKRQKCRTMNVERYKALREEVDKLIRNGFIGESRYPDWVDNPMLVKKPNGK